MWTFLESLGPIAGDEFVEYRTSIAQLGSIDLRAAQLEIQRQGGELGLRSLSFYDTLGKNRAFVNDEGVDSYTVFKYVVCLDMFVLSMCSFIYNNKNKTVSVKYIYFET